MTRAMVAIGNQQNTDSFRLCPHASGLSAAILAPCDVLGSRETESLGAAPGTNTS